MKHFALLIAAALLVLAPQVLRAHEYQDATMRFTVPDDYAYQIYNNEKQGIKGFSTAKDGMKITLFRITTDKRIDRVNCLTQPDNKWLPGLSKFALVEKSKPLWKRYDLISDYRSDQGYVRVYRYVDRKGIGFLVAESKQPKWDGADKIASSQRYEITAGYLLDRGWYLFWRLFSYFILASCVIYAIYVLLTNIRNVRLWLLLALCGTVGGLLIYFEPFIGRKLWIIATAIGLAWSLLWVDKDDSNSSDDNGPSDGGYDGTGTTINYDF